MLIAVRKAIEYRWPVMVNIAMTLIEPLPVGLLFTLVTAVAMSRRRKVGEPAVA